MNHQEFLAYMAGWVAGLRSANEAMVKVELPTEEKVSADLLDYKNKIQAAENERVLADVFNNLNPEWPADKVAAASYKSREAAKEIAKFMCNRSAIQPFTIEEMATLLLPFFVRIQIEK